MSEQWIVYRSALYVTGVLCQENVNECASSPCLNNGLCIDLPQRFECECQAGFQGTLCEVNIDECRSAPCKNAISCIDKVSVLVQEWSCGDRGREVGWGG